LEIRRTLVGDQPRKGRKRRNEGRKEGREGKILRIYFLKTITLKNL
jgi:hypothetical protein